MYKNAIIPYFFRLFTEYATGDKFVKLYLKQITEIQNHLLKYPCDSISQKWCIVTKNQSSKFSLQQSHLLLHGNLMLTQLIAPTTFQHRLQFQCYSFLFRKWKFPTERKKTNVVRVQKKGDQKILKKLPTNIVTSYCW